MANTQIYLSDAEIKNSINNFKMAGTKLTGISKGNHVGSQGMPGSVRLAILCTRLETLIQNYGTLVIQDADQIMKKVEAIQAQDKT